MDGSWLQSTITTANATPGWLESEWPVRQKLLGVCGCKVCSERHDAASVSISTCSIWIKSVQIWPLISEERLFALYRSNRLSFKSPNCFIWVVKPTQNQNYLASWCISIRMLRSTGHHNQLLLVMLVELASGKEKVNKTGWKEVVGARCSIGTLSLMTSPTTWPWRGSALRMKRLRRSSQRRPEQRWRGQSFWWRIINQKISIPLKKL